MTVLFALQVGVLGGMTGDPSFWNFYWLMGVAGAIFGFDMWWGYEQGPFNPHDRQ